MADEPMGSAPWQGRYVYDSQAIRPRYNNTPPGESRLTASGPAAPTARPPAAHASPSQSGQPPAAPSWAVIADNKRLLAWAIRRAERDGLAGHNVAALAEVPSSGERRSRSMTLEQVRALLRSDLTPFWRAYVTTGVMCGLRPGELLGLRWQDVDFAEGVLRVRASMRATGELGALKTPQSHRSLVMPAAVVTALRGLKADQAAVKLRMGRHYADLDLVFPAADGRPMRRQRARVGLRRVTGAAGIGGDWVPRELRHTFVSVLSNAGVDIEVIADAAGHTTANVTRAVYRHQIADKVSAAAEAMDRVFGAGGAS